MGLAKIFFPGVFAMSGGNEGKDVFQIEIPPEGNDEFHPRSDSGAGSGDESRPGPIAESKEAAGPRSPIFPASKKGLVRRLDFVHIAGRDPKGAHPPEFGDENQETRAAENFSKPF